MEKVELFVKREEDELLLRSQLLKKKRKSNDPCKLINDCKAMELTLQAMELICMKIIYIPLHYVLQMAACYFCPS